MLVWEKEHSSADCRIAIAGDFLPASGLQLPAHLIWDQVASSIRERFNPTDAAILNLECSINVGHCRPRCKLGLGDTFAARPDVLDFPRALGAKVIGLANNHTCDYGEEGLERTRRAVLDAGLVPLGIASSLSESPDVGTVNTRFGLCVGFWAAARHLPELATRNKPGIEPATRKRGRDALAALKACGSTVNIAFLHAGLERSNRPDPDDVALMDDLAKMGFDVVAASHSHRISGYKRIRRANGSAAFCFYGLGSISSGVLYSPLEREGLAVVAGFRSTGEIARVEAHPVYLEGSGWGTVPDSARADAILDRFMDLSQEIGDGSYRARFYRETGKGLFGRQFRDMQAAFENGGLRGLASKLSRVRVRHLTRVFHKSIG
jgi:poly-gamma-glutamate capsule biosynthesis protein CapA/YwtB (metallophosphatase superfamily)